MLLDRAIVAYAESLQGQTAEIPHLDTASKQRLDFCGKDNFFWQRFRGYLLIEP